MHQQTCSLLLRFFCCSLLKSHTTNFTPNLDCANSFNPFFFKFQRVISWLFFFLQALEVWIPYTPPRYPFNFFFTVIISCQYIHVYVYSLIQHVRDLIGVTILQVHNLISDPQALDPPSFIEKRNNE